MKNIKIHNPKYRRHKIKIKETKLWRKKKKLTKFWNQEAILVTNYERMFEALKQLDLSRTIEDKNNAKKLNLDNFVIITKTTIILIH